MIYDTIPRKRYHSHKVEDVRAPTLRPLGLSSGLSFFPTIYY